MRESIFKFLRKVRGNSYARLYRLALFLSAIARLTLLLPLLVLPNRLLSRAAVLRALTKWRNIATWSLAFSARQPTMTSNTKALRLKVTEATWLRRINCSETHSARPTISNANERGPAVASDRVNLLILPRGGRKDKFPVCDELILICAKGSTVRRSASTSNRSSINANLMILLPFQANRDRQRR